MNLQALLECDICHGPSVGKTKHGKAIQFYVVSIESHFLEVSKVNRFLGLQQFMGGSEMLAHIFNPEPNCTIKTAHREMHICQHCMMKHAGLLMEGGKDLPCPEFDAAKSEVSQ